MRRFAAIVLALLVCACTARTVTTTRKLRASLHIQCNVPDASVSIDDVLIGEVQEFRRGIGLRPGTHRVMLRHDRYHTRYVELVLRDGERHNLDVSMVEMLD